MSGAASTLRGRVPIKLQARALQAKTAQATERWCAVHARQCAMCNNSSRGPHVRRSLQRSRCRAAAP